VLLQHRARLVRPQLERRQRVTYRKQDEPHSKVVNFVNSLDGYHVSAMRIIRFGRLWTPMKK
jgi:hypothetical protein